MGQVGGRRRAEVHTFLRIVMDSLFTVVQRVGLLKTMHPVRVMRMLNRCLPEPVEIHGTSFYAELVAPG